MCLGAKLFRTKTSLHLASKATEIVFQKTTSSVRIFSLNSTTATIKAKRTIWRDWGQNCPGAKFRISEKLVYGLNFFTKQSPPIFGAKRTVWCVWRPNYFTRKLRFIWPQKPPKSFFQKKRFQSKFFWIIVSHSNNGTPLIFHS